MTIIAWIKDRALLLLVGLIAALFAWGYFHALGEAGLTLMLVVVFLSEIVDSFRLRKRMKRFAANPEALRMVTDEFRKLVASGDKKKAIALYRDTFALSTGEALNAIEEVKEPKQ